MWQISTNYYQVKIIQHLLERKNVLLTLACLWTIFIAYMCLANFKRLPTIGIRYPDKYVHVAFHFVFTILWIFYLKAKKANNTSFVKVILASVIYGSLIEIAQGLFTTTRHADIRDVFANTIGSFIAVIIIFMITKFSSIKI